MSVISRTSLDKFGLMFKKTLRILLGESANKVLPSQCQFTLHHVIF
jgi:hypothetical protein